jgi:hypothetical protein
MAPRMAPREWLLDLTRANLARLYDIWGVGDAPQFSPARKGWVPVATIAPERRRRGTYPSRVVGLGLCSLVVFAGSICISPRSILAERYPCVLSAAPEKTARRKRNTRPHKTKDGTPKIVLADYLRAIRREASRLSPGSGSPSHLGIRIGTPFVVSWPSKDGSREYAKSIEVLSNALGKFMCPTRFLGIRSASNVAIQLLVSVTTGRN